MFSTYSLFCLIQANYHIKGSSMLKLVPVNLIKQISVFSAFHLAKKNKQTKKNPLLDDLKGSCKKKNI